MIPAEAVEAAADIIVQGDRGACECRRSIFDKHDVNPPCSTRREALRIARAALEAAAPHMHAVILDDAAEPSGGGKAMEIQVSAPTRITEQNELALVIAAAEGWERQDLTTDVLEDYLQTAAEVLAAGFRKATK